MTLEIAAFWIFAAVLAGAGLAVVLSKNLFHSVLWLALALVATAGIFLTLDAEFLAAVQILLYAGGVVTVVVFAIVVTERPSAWTASTVHDFTARLSRWTVQDPHWDVQFPVTRTPQAVVVEQ